MIEFLAEELEDVDVAALGVAHAHVEGVASKGPCRNIGYQNRNEIVISGTRGVYTQFGLRGTG